MIATQDGLDARQQHFHVEGFGHIVVGAQLQAQHLLQFAAAGGDKDHRQVGVAAHLAQRVEAIHARQPDVKQDEVRARRGDLGQAILRRGGCDHLVAGAFQGKGQATAQQGIVVDEENLFGHGKIVTEENRGGEPVGGG